MRFIWILNNRVTLYRSIYRYYIMKQLINIYIDILKLNYTLNNYKYIHYNIKYPSTIFGKKKHWLNLMTEKFKYKTLAIIKKNKND